VGSLRTIRSQSVQDFKLQEFYKILDCFPPRSLWDDGILVLESDLDYFDYHDWLCFSVLIFKDQIFDLDSPALNRLIRVRIRSVEWLNHAKTSRFWECGYIDTTGIDYFVYHEYIVSRMKQYFDRGLLLPWFCNVEVGGLWDYSQFILPEQITSWLAYINS
jgi:hypothetical protein